MHSLAERRAGPKVQRKRRGMEAQEAGGSDDYNGPVFKPVVMQLEGGVDEQHGKVYGGGPFEAGWRLQVTDEIYARMSKFGGIVEVNIQNEARIYAKLFILEYNLLWAGLFFVGGLAFVGLPTGTDVATPMDFEIDPGAYANPDQMFVQYFVEHFRPQLALIAYDFPRRVTDDARVELADLRQFAAKQFTPSGLPEWSAKVGNQVLPLFFVFCHTIPPPNVNMSTRRSAHHTLVRRHPTVRAGSVLRRGGGGGFSLDSGGFTQ